MTEKTLTDADATAMIANMTMPEREALVIRCEEMWEGTPLQQFAEQLRRDLNAARRELN